MSESQADLKLVGELVNAAIEDRPRARQLLKQHPELLRAKWRGESPLQFLVVENFPPEAIRFLAQQGFDVNATNQDGDSALVDAVFLGNAPMVATLIELGATVDVVSRLGLTPLQTAVSLGRPDILEQLLGAGASTTFDGPLGGLQATVETLCPAEAKETVIAVLRAHGCYDKPR